MSLALLPNARIPQSSPKLRMDSKLLKYQRAITPRSCFVAGLIIILSNRYAISERGEAYSWGQGRYGALGHDDDERNHTKPTRLVGFQTTPMRRLACGRWHCAALVGVNQIFLWGRNHCGQLGIGFISRACSTPVAIVLDSEQHSNLLARDVAAGATPPS